MEKESLLVGFLVVDAMLSGCAVIDDPAYRFDRYDRGSHGKTFA